MLKERSTVSATTLPFWFSSWSPKIRFFKMNRGEQENLFRQSHTFRLQQDGMNKAHKLHLQNQRRNRGYSQGNIHHLSSSLHSNTRPFGASGRACDDLVLSVLKTPVRDATTLVSPITTTTMLPLSTLNATAVVNQPPFIPPQQLNILPTRSSTHSSGQSPTKYQTLQASEDELLDDVESAKETTKLSGFIDDDEDGIEKDSHRRSSGGFKFLRRFRSPKIDENNRRVPTPHRRRSRGRSPVPAPSSGHGKWRTI